MAETAPGETWTIGKVLTWSTQFLKDRGQDQSPRLDAELLLAHALGLSRIQLYTDYDKPLAASERQPFKALLLRRGTGEPIAYITGQKEFMGHAFTVTPAVLIPRPDTELLVETVLGWRPEAGAWRLLDVGTGSGCIAISLVLAAAKQVELYAEAWDISTAALAVARENASRLEAKVTFATMDALDPRHWQSATDDDRFDAIVANPPYIAPAETTGSPPRVTSEVMRFEPHQALLAPPDGLIFYRHLATHAPRRLRSGGRLAVEIGSGQGQEVLTIFRAAGWQDMELLKDYGRLDRVVTARWV